MNYCFKIAVFAKIFIKCITFIEKLKKLPSAWGFASRLPCLQRQRALSPEPQPSAAGSFSSRPPVASGD